MININKFTITAAIFSWTIIIWICSLVYNSPKSDGWFWIMLAFMFATIDTYVGLVREQKRMEDSNNES